MYTDLYKEDYTDIITGKMLICNYSVAPEYWGKGSNFILKHFLFFQDYLKSLHDLHEDWLVKRTKFSLPSKVLVGKIYLIHFQ